MSTKTLNQEYSSKDERKFVVSNQEVTTRKWKFNSIFKFITGIIYGFFFGLLPASFIFNTSIEPSNPNKNEVNAIISLFFIGILSIVLIFWAFRGDIKKKKPTTYWICHLLNSLLLSVGIMLVTILEPNTVGEVQPLNENRFLILAISYLGYAMLMMLVLFISMFKNRREFPLSWSRYGFTAFTLLFLGVSESLNLLSVQQANIESNSSSFLFLILSIISIVIATMIYGLGISYIRRFRDILLGERTEYEIDSIRDWESSRVMAIIMASAMIITFTASIIFKNASGLFNENNDLIPLYIEVCVDFVLVIPYLILIAIIKVNNIKNYHLNIAKNKIFKTIDNGLMIDAITWIIIIKAIILEGLFISENPVWAAQNNFKSLLILISFVSLMLLYGISTLIQLNTPNLRNTLISVPTIASTIILGIFVILFSGYLYVNVNAVQMSKWIFVLMPLIPAIGISISFITKICIVAKIFKVEWKEPEEQQQNEELEEQQQNDEDNHFMNSKSEEVSKNIEKEVKGAA